MYPRFDSEENFRMILRHFRETMDGQTSENTFEAVDERSGAAVCTCTIYVHENAELFPARPVRIYLDIQGSPVPDALLGAAVARAKEIALNTKAPCRIFTQVEPDNTALMTSLSILGFKDSDGLVCMRRSLNEEADVQPPLSCVVVKDDLDDAIEQKYFLERYNQLFSEECDFEWLQDFRNRKGFGRILIVAPTGMAGEAVTWQEGGRGKIGWIFVSRKWRKHGVSKCLLDIACREFEKAGLSCAEAEVQARIPGMLRAMEGGGFRQAELILRYPGIDYN